jgi:hypothetical protein
VLVEGPEITIGLVGTRRVVKRVMNALHTPAVDADEGHRMNLSVSCTAQFLPNDTAPIMTR